MEKKFSGLLELDSKKVYNELRQLFGDDILSEFNDLYSKRSNLYHVEERNLNRTVGANYNPKILRVLLLQIRDAYVKHINTFKATLFLDVPDKLVDSLIVGNEIYSILVKVKGALKELNASILRKEEESLVFSALLDEIRHYHQELNPSEDRILGIQDYLNSFNEVVNEALYSKCLHALKLQGLRV